MQTLNNQKFSPKLINDMYPLEFNLFKNLSNQYCYKMIERKKCCYLKFTNKYDTIFFGGRQKVLTAIICNVCRKQQLQYYSLPPFTGLLTFTLSYFVVVFKLTLSSMCQVEIGSRKTFNWGVLGECVPAHQNHFFCCLVFSDDS